MVVVSRAGDKNSALTKTFYPSHGIIIILPFSSPPVVFKFGHINGKKDPYLFPVKILVLVELIIDFKTLFPPKNSTDHRMSSIFIAEAVCTLMSPRMSVKITPNHLGISRPASVRCSMNRDNAAPILHIFNEFFPHFFSGQSFFNTG